VRTAIRVHVLCDRFDRCRCALRHRRPLRTALQAHQNALGGEALASLMKRVEENAAHVSSLTHKVGAKSNANLSQPCSMAERESA
jgi:hypothetical protein